jgi:hypothetical protein
VVVFSFFSYSCFAVRNGYQVVLIILVVPSILLVPIFLFIPVILAVPIIWAIPVIRAVSIPLVVPDTLVYSLYSRCTFFYSGSARNTSQYFTFCSRTRLFILS